MNCETVSTIWISIHPPPPKLSPLYLFRHNSELNCCHGDSTHHCSNHRNSLQDQIKERVRRKKCIYFSVDRITLNSWTFCTSTDTHSLPFFDVRLKRILKTEWHKVVNSSEMSHVKWLEAALNQRMKTSNAWESHPSLKWTSVNLTEVQKSVTTLAWTAGTAGESMISEEDVCIRKSLSEF